MAPTKECFVICPVGEDGSTTRVRSGFIYEHYITRALNGTDYYAVRSIDRETPGKILESIVTSIYNADLVIADLTDFNPNVFYELALRHSTGKPVIHIAETTNALPFDVKDWDVIKVKQDFSIEQYTKAYDKLKHRVNHIKEGNFTLPGSKMGGNVIYGYKWHIYYSDNLADEWVEKQRNHRLRLFIKQFQSDGGTPEEDLRTGFAEYQALKMAHTTKLFGNLYFTFTAKSKTYFEGWGNFRFTSPDEPLAIPINGKKTSDTSMNINFQQPSRLFKIEPNFEVRIRPFNYDADFKQDGEGFVGKIYHPDFPKGDKGLLVADTELIPL